MYVVYDNFKQFSKNKFQFGKLSKTPTHDVYTLYVSKKDGQDSPVVNKKIYFVSQILKIAWDKIYSHDDTSFSFELCSYQNNFVERFRNLLACILKNFRKRMLHGKLTDEDIQLDCFKKYSNGAMTMRVYNMRISDIRIYNEDHIAIDSTYLKRNDLLNVLLEMHCCWVKDDKIGFDFNVVQIMRINPHRALNERCLINSVSTQKSLLNPAPQAPPPPPAPPMRLLLDEVTKARPPLQFSLEDLRNARNNLRLVSSSHANENDKE